MSQRSGMHGLRAPNLDVQKAYVEFILKFPTSLTETDILAAGAKRLGCVTHDDCYYLQPQMAVTSSLSGSGLIRIRTENGTSLSCSYRDELPGSKGVTIATLTPAAMTRIKNEYTHVLDVSKRRVMYVLGPVIVNYDVVDGVGTFIELVVAAEKDYGRLLAAAQKLGLPLQTATSQTYFQLAYTQTATMRRLANMSSHMTWFGSIVPSVLVTMAVVVALQTRGLSSTGISTVIAAIALTYALLDLGDVQRHASRIHQLMGKTVCIMAFIPLMSMSYALLLCTIWSMLLVIGAHLVKKSTWQQTTVSVSMLFFAIILSYAVSLLL